MTITSMILATAIVLASAILPISCRLQWLHINPATQQFSNENGSEVFLHGVNVVYKVPPWIPELVLEHHKNSFTDTDIEKLKSWGFNIVRLGIMWPGLHHEPDKTNTTYLNLIEGIVNRLAARGIYTLLDLHQDVASRYFCGEGIPEYFFKGMVQTQKFPAPVSDPYETDANGFPSLQTCLKMDNFANYYFAYSVNDAFEGVYKLGSEMNQALNRFWREVAERFASNPGVVGYDLMNEPIVGHRYKDVWNFFNPFGSAAHNLMEPLYEQLHQTIRRVDDLHILFFETALNHVIFKSGLSQGPGGKAYLDRQAYSQHLYCGIVTPSGCPKSQWLCNFVENLLLYFKMAETHKLGCGTLLTEFGALCEEDGCIEDLHRVLSKAEQAHMGWAYWQYKQFNDFTTTNKDESEGFYHNATGKLQTKKVHALTRPYVRRVAGRIKESGFDLTESTYWVKYTVSADVKDQVTEIYVNCGYFGNKAPRVKKSTEGLIQRVTKVNGTPEDMDKYVILEIVHDPIKHPAGTLIELSLVPMESEA